MKLSIKKFADISGVSVRTLHYYDDICLLKPDFVDEQNGYRFYGETAFSRMQEILFYRELDFPLKTISEILSSPSYNKNETLKQQKQLLIMKKERLEKIINALECAEKGGQVMNFEAFNQKDINTYKDEVKARWGNTDAYKENQEKTAGYSSDKWNEISSGLNEIISEFASTKTAMQSRQMKQH